MSRRSTVFVIFTIGALAATTLALATQPQEQDQTAPGRFQVSSSGKFPILLDTASGETWVLRPAVVKGGFPSDAKWLPLEQIDGHREAWEWVKTHIDHLNGGEARTSMKSVDTPWGTLTWWE